MLPAFFRWLATGVAPERPAAAELKAGERLYRPIIGGFRAGGVAHSRELETIRFAAANRLCVDLGYKGETRRIEPYSLRRTRKATFSSWPSDRSTASLAVTGSTGPRAPP